MNAVTKLEIGQQKTPALYVRYVFADPDKLYLKRVCKCIEAELDCPAETIVVKEDNGIGQQIIELRVFLRNKADPTILRKIADCMIREI